jgi:ATP dependent DNA ligase-like protein
MTETTLSKKCGLLMMKLHSPLPHFILRSRSCIIDGEAVACDDNGVASFDRVRHHRANERIFLYAFDLIELNGDDLRRDPLEVRKATLASIVAKASAGIRFNGACGNALPRSPAHAAAWLRLRPSQRRPRHQGATGLARAQEHPAHGSIRRAFARPVPGLLEGLIAKSHRPEPRQRHAAVLF